MGHVQSKDSHTEELERAGTQFCYTLTSRDSKILEIPQSVSDMFVNRRAETCHLADCNGVRFQILIVHHRNTASLGCGWHNFVQEAGTEPGDTLIFDFVGGGMANVTVFRANGWQRLPRTNATYKQGDHPIDVLVSPSCGCETISQMRREGYEGWIKTGPGVVLEKWMEEYLAAQTGGEKPKTPFYLASIQTGSLNGCAQYFPADYIARAIRPLLKSKNEQVVLRPSDAAGPRVTLKISRDGRGMLTRGWRDFATRNGVRPGAIVAFSFDQSDGGALISMDVMNESSTN
ncbi:hypothetical protein ACP70R_034418 [Stipagrostis hirtigluma subsp. patula]